MYNQLTVDFKEATNIVTGKLEGWLKGAIEILPNFAVAIVVVIAFIGLARLIQWGIKKIFFKANTNQAVLNLVASIFYVITLLIGLFIALGLLNLDKTVTSLLAGAGIIGLALGFAFQDIAANFLSGIMMAFRKPLQVGDHVETNDYTGTVLRINMRTTSLRTFQGQEVMIPNKDVFNSPIKNYTKRGERRVDLEVGVSYGDDLEQVEQLVLETINNLKGVDKNQDIRLEYTEFGDSSINFRLSFWLEDIKQKSYMQTRSGAIKAIKVAFDNNNVTIPFPIRTLDFGIKGGETYTEAYTNAYVKAHANGGGKGGKSATKSGGADGA